MYVISLSAKPRRASASVAVGARLVIMILRTSFKNFFVFAIAALKCERGVHSVREDDASLSDVGLPFPGELRRDRAILMTSPSPKKV